MKQVGAGFGEAQETYVQTCVQKQSRTKSHSNTADGRVTGSDAEPVTVPVAQLAAVGEALPVLF